MSRGPEGPGGPTKMIPLVWGPHCSLSMGPRGLATAVIVFDIAEQACVETIMYIKRLNSNTRAVACPEKLGGRGGGGTK